MTNFLITKDVQESDFGEYTELYRSSKGLKLVLSYKVSSRVDLNAYGRLGVIDGFTRNYDVTPAPDDISGGMTIGYRLFGKEVRYKAKIEEEKKVYKLDYSK